MPNTLDITLIMQPLDTPLQRGPVYYIHRRYSHLKYYLSFSDCWLQHHAIYYHLLDHQSTATNRYMSRRYSEEGIQSQCQG